MEENVCKIGGEATEGEFDALCAAMSKDSYWFGFFARPCCPAPGFAEACSRLDRLADEVRAREDFSGEQRDTLIGMIEGRKEWYKTCGLCKKE